MKKKIHDIVTPFDWKRFTAPAAPNAEPKRNRPMRPKKPLTVRERVARILAQRWGNPYCKPGAA